MPPEINKCVARIIPRKMTIRGACVAIFSAVLAIAAPPVGQDPGARLLESVVKANSMVLHLENGSLKGAGAAFLLDEAARSQFVALGEEHNTTEIPELTTALFRALQGNGFEYVADEQDPVTLRMASAKPARGNRDSLVAFARKYPSAFTFVSDQELTMLADLGAASRGRGNALWGCDQAFGVTHILDRLIPLLQKPEARTLAMALRDKARDKEGVRNLEKFHYMSEVPKSDELAGLERVAAASAGSEAAFLIQALVVSDRVYRNYREKNYYDNGYEREEYMKQRFLEEYRRAQTADGRAPKVILKFGHWHLFRGQGPSNLQTLGNFVSEFAIANGSRSFHVAIYPFGDSGGYGDIKSWKPSTAFLLAAGSSASQWTIVDVRPLRAVYRQVTEKMSAEERDSFRRTVFGFDAVLYVGHMRPATYLRNPGVAF